MGLDDRSYRHGTCVSAFSITDHLPHPAEQDSCLEVFANGSLVEPKLRNAEGYWWYEAAEVDGGIGEKLRYTA